MWGRESTFAWAAVGFGDFHNGALTREGKSPTEGEDWTERWRQMGTDAWFEIGLETSIG